MFNRFWIGSICRQLASGTEALISKFFLSLAEVVGKSASSIFRQLHVKAGQSCNTSEFNSLQRRSICHPLLDRPLPVNPPPPQPHSNGWRGASMAPLQLATSSMPLPMVMMGPQAKPADTPMPFTQAAEPKHNTRSGCQQNPSVSPWRAASPATSCHWPWSR